MLWYCSKQGSLAPPSTTRPMHTTMSATKLTSALALSAALLAGCGGGGGDPAAEGPIQPVFNVEAALADLFRTEGEFELAGRDPLGNPLRRIYSFVPGVPADPRVGNTLATRVEEWSPDWPDQRNRTIYYYTVNPFRLVARTLSSSSIMYYTQTAEIPIGAAVGSGFGFAEGQEPQGSQLERVRWDVREADASGTAWVCLENAQIRSGSFLCTLARPEGTVPRRRAGGWSIGSSYDLQSPP